MGYNWHNKLWKQEDVNVVGERFPKNFWSILEDTVHHVMLLVYRGRERDNDRATFRP